jgi:hypothetical protein
LLSFIHAELVRSKPVSVGERAERALNDGDIDVQLDQHQIGRSTKYVDVLDKLNTLGLQSAKNLPRSDWHVMELFLEKEVDKVLLYQREDASKNR